jgi:hypothetical protein
MQNLVETFYEVFNDPHKIDINKKGTIPIKEYEQLIRPLTLVFFNGLVKKINEKINQQKPLGIPLIESDNKKLENGHPTKWTWGQLNAVAYNLKARQDHGNKRVELRVIESLNFKRKDKNDTYISVWFDNKRYWNEIKKYKDNDDSIGYGIWYEEFEGVGGYVNDYHPENYITFQEVKDKSDEWIYEQIASYLIDKCYDDYVNHFDKIKEAIKKQEAEEKNSEDESDMDTEKNKNSKDTNLEMLITTLKTKPFLILAGVSGTGKTQIARLVAGVISKKEEENVQ